MHRGPMMPTIQGDEDPALHPRRSSPDLQRARKDDIPCPFNISTSPMAQSGYGCTNVHVKEESV